MGWLSGRALAVMIGFTAVMVAGWNALLWAQASPATQQSANTAQQIQADIQTKLQRDADLRDNHIDVRVVNDVATLKGIVDSDAERAKAVRLAAVGGVKVVDDQLKVQSTGVKEEVNDTAITSKVMAQLIATTALRHANIEAPGPIGFRCFCHRAGAPSLFGPAPGVHALPESLGARPGVGVKSDQQRSSIYTARGDTAPADPGAGTGSEGWRGNATAGRRNRRNRRRL